MVNIQKPFDKPEYVLEYLSRYVFRVAITDRRIIEIKDGKVLFSWRDYRTNLFRKMKLDVDEFIRRFLLHTLPQGFFKSLFVSMPDFLKERVSKKLINSHEDSKTQRYH